MNLEVIIGIATGVILFLYGIESFSREIKSIAGEDLRKILSKWTKRPVYGMVLGALVTASIQSSTATSVLTVSLVNSAVITFHQSIGIILGTNIGTTVTAFLVAHKLTDIGPWFIVCGFLLSIIKIKYSFFGKALFYFGLVFFALSQLSAVTYPLKNDPVFAAYFASFGNPLIGVLAGGIITIIIQSSSVTTGLVVILVQSSAIELSEAIPIILGANVGTTFTGIIASIGMDTYARRAAAVNTIFNIGGVILFLPFLYPFTKFIESLGATPGQMTAIAHLLFNLGSSFIFVFLVKFLEALATKIIKSGEHEIIFQTLHLPQKIDDNLEQNLDLIEKEITHYFDVGKQSLSSVISYIDLRTRDGLERVEKYIAYSTYLSKQIESAIHDLGIKHHDKKVISNLFRLIRIVDFTRQAIVSQRQIAEIPDLLRLPYNEELTDLKAEIFGMASLVCQLYEHLNSYLSAPSRIDLHHIDATHAKLTKRINDTYEQIVFEASGPKDDRLQSFYLSFLTRLQSIKSKLREVRKLSVLYTGQPNGNDQNHRSKT